MKSIYEKYAELLVRYSLELKKGERLLIADMKDSGEMYADGEMIYRNGEFLL
jgi:leucyl aminopeptidase (aminopeptidase T)